MANGPIPAGRIIAAYLKIRREKQAYVRAAQEIEAEYDAKLDRLSVELLKRMNADKIKNITGDGGEGIAIKTKDIIPRADDWDKFYGWVRETNSFEALERRIKKTFIDEYMKENKGAIPPGVSVLTSFKVVVRKAPSKKGLPDGEE